MSFSLGEHVLLLHESGKGVIKEIYPDGRYLIEDEDGFNRVCHAGELCKIFGDNTKLSRSVDDVDLSHHDGDGVKRVANKKNNGLVEIDLHIESLLESTSGMTNHEIVQYQLNVLKRFLNNEMTKKTRKVLIIHGVGEGVLRNEVHHYLRGISGAVFHNEHYTPKGFGATLLELRYDY